MAYPQNDPLNLALVDARLADISTASTAYAASPFHGALYRAYSCLQGAISGSNCTWSMTVNGVAVPNSTVTVTASGSAAGDVDSVEFSRMNPTVVNKGDTIGFVSAGESSTAAACNFSVLIRT
jgi:hypothetical protein